MPLEPPALHLRQTAGGAASQVLPQRRPGPLGPAWSQQPTLSRQHHNWWVSTCLSIRTTRRPPAHPQSFRSRHPVEGKAKGGADPGGESQIGGPAGPGVGGTAVTSGIKALLAQAGPPPQHPLSSKRPLPWPPLPPPRLLSTSRTLTSPPPPQPAPRKCLQDLRADGLWGSSRAIVASLGQGSRWSWPESHGLGPSVLGLK